jgi:Uncharacterized ACR, COG1993
MDWDLTPRSRYLDTHMRTVGSWIRPARGWNHSVHAQRPDTNRTAAWSKLRALAAKALAQTGKTFYYHTETILRLSQDLPVVIEVVEFIERIERILPQLDDMVGGGLVMLEKVRVILYRSNK